MPLFLLYETVSEHMIECSVLYAVRIPEIVYLSTFQLCKNVKMYIVYSHLLITMTIECFALVTYQKG